MKKTLLTCFLALLCLVGRYFTASSKVADSPMEAPNHRSALHVSPHSGDTHRGGETLSDTFNYNKALEIDGGPIAIGSFTATLPSGAPRSDVAACPPWRGHPAPLPSLVLSEVEAPVSGLQSSFSLVDQHLDPGAGEEATSLQPAPVTVFALPTPVIPHPAPPGMLYIEIASPNPPDTLWVTYWEHLLNERKSVTPGVAVPLIGAYGNMFEGSFHKMVYTFSFPKGISNGFFSLGKGDNSLVRHWYFSATDRVRIRFDLVSGTVLFGGPDAEFYRTQYRLDQLFAENLFNQDPVIISATRESLFEDSTNRPLYQTALKKPDDLHVKMQILVPEENGWEFFKPFLESSWTSHPTWEALEYHRNALDEDQFNSMEARVKGELLFLGIQKAELSLRSIKEDPIKAALFLDWAKSFSLHEETYTHPKLVEAATMLANLASRIEGKPLFSVLENFSPALRDQIIGYYVLDNFNRFGDQLPELLDQSLAVVSTPWIAERLTEINRLHRSELVSHGLWDSSGNPVDLREFKGKTLLLHFWISGCKFCLHEYATVMKGLSGEYVDNPDILLVSINVDSNPDTWKRSLATGKYTSPDMLNLRADKNSGLAPHYKIYSFPQKMIVGPDFKIRLQTINRMEGEKIKELLEGFSREAAHTFSSLRSTYQ